MAIGTRKVDGARIVERWVKEMVPIARANCHFSFGLGEKFNSDFFDAGTRVEIDNHSNRHPATFEIKLNFSYSPLHSSFFYARTIKPYSVGELNALNELWASRVLNAVAPAVQGLGFECQIDGRHNLSVADGPALIVTGKVPHRRFGDFRRLASATSTLVDGYLTKAESEKDRTHKYAMVRENGDKGLFKLFPIESGKILDDKGTIGVMETLFPLSQRQIETTVYSVKFPLSALGGYDGRVISVGEFIGARKRIKSV